MVIGLPALAPAIDVISARLVLVPPKLIVVLPIVTPLALSFATFIAALPLISASSILIFNRFDQSTLASISPLVPLNTSLVFVESGIKVNLPVLSS